MLQTWLLTIGQINKFLYGLSDLVEPECRNAMLLGDMNISRNMAHAQQFEGDKLGNMPMRIGRLGL